MSGYVPGEQPDSSGWIKLNTNEFPYPPSPKVVEAIAKEVGADGAKLRLYPSPISAKLREQVAKYYDLEKEYTFAANGSDDVLNLVIRAFADSEKSIATLDPSYSLYPVLAKIQGANFIQIPFSKNMEIDFEKVASCGANVFFFTNPNAPTGFGFPIETVEKIVSEFDGIVLIDEAYGDFSADNCMDLVKEFDNVIVMRTFSKSCSMAGVRLGYAVSNPVIIEGLMKLKDSYNVDMLSQIVGKANYLDKEYRAECIAAIKRDRNDLYAALLKIGFEIPESHANFLFAAPPDGDGESCFRYLRENAVLVRYFKGDVTGRYIRITIGTPEENRRVLELLTAKYA